MAIKVLVSGVTGYIGGAVLAELLKSNTKGIYEISAIVRKQSQADVLEKNGVHAISFAGLEDLDACRNAASKHDVVIAVSSAKDDSSADAWVRGLGERRRSTGQPVYYIHTSGETVCGYLSALGAASEVTPWSDADDAFDVYQERFPETLIPRPTRLPLFNTADKEGVTAAVILPTTVFGTGTGFFSKRNCQVEDLTHAALKHGKAIVVGSGNGVWSRIHISDLSRLYVTLLTHLTTAASPPLPSHPIIWAENGTHTWRETSASIAKALHSLGALDTDEVEELPITEAAKLMADGHEKMTAAVWGSSAVGRSDLARRVLGWVPEYGEESWRGHFRIEAEVAWEKVRGGP